MNVFRNELYGLRYDSAYTAFNYDDEKEELIAPKKRGLFELNEEGKGKVGEVLREDKSALSSRLSVPIPRLRV